MYCLMHACIVHSTYAYTVLRSILCLQWKLAERHLLKYNLLTIFLEMYLCTVLEKVRVLSLSGVSINFFLFLFINFCTCLRLIIFNNLIFE